MSQEYQEQEELPKGSSLTMESRSSLTLAEGGAPSDQDELFIDGGAPESENACMISVGEIPSGDDWD